MKYFPSYGTIAYIKTRKKEIGTSVCSAEHPKAGQNIQHSLLFLFLFCFIFRLNRLQHCIWFCVVIWHYQPKKNWFFDKTFDNFSARPTRLKRTAFWLAPSNDTFLVQLKFGREKVNFKMAEILNMFREAVWFRGSERGDGVNKAIVVDRKLKPITFHRQWVIIGRKLDLKENLVKLLKISNKVQGLLVCSMLKIMVHLHWLYREFEDRQVPPT